MHRHIHLLPFAAATLGVALFAGMDAAMKGLALALGAYSAMLWRQAFAVLCAAPFYLGSRENWPSRPAFRFHLLRGGVSAVMAVAWFYGLARLPMAEAIALSFIAPLVALYLAAALLGERIARQSIFASLLGIAGMLVLLAARLGDGGGERHLDGVLAILGSAMLYAWNLILMRQQALVASPAEVSFFQSLISGSWLLAFLPVAALLWPGQLGWPEGTQWLLLALAATLTVSSLWLLSWAYGRSEAQALVPVEYSAFLWAVLLGAAVYGEALRPTTLAGAVLIVAGCLLAARRPRHVSPMVEGAI
ncbi:DMT family transporter [Sphingomonas sp. BN140010]|uniref:DMT family transporter n=1 Tax=Sphingomonas arvum TaxID=2992113 RepID=A0ABT3JEZ0_9SPHN|nr:DMT family transporter [Sphingomonas sp. BN140010]MCW3797642.1 DMT family transporter [Sphingomonas sp. BN140010]